MKKNNSKKSQPVNGKPQKIVNLGSKPHKIGPTLKRLSEERKLTPEDIARELGIEVESVYRIFKQAHLHPLKMMAWSELLDYDLFEEYKPDVTRKPNPLQEKLDAVTKERDELLKLPAEMERLEKKIIEIEAERDFADRKLDQYVTRRIG